MKVLFIEDYQPLLKSVSKAVREFMLPKLSGIDVPRAQNFIIHASIFCLFPQGASSAAHLVLCF